MSECALVLPFTDQVYDMDTASLKLLRVRLVEEQSKNHDEAVAERVTELLDAVSLEIEERALAADFEENCEKILGSFDSFLKDVGKLIEENAPDGQGARLPQIATTKKRSDTEMHELNRGRITLPPIQATHLREESPPLQAPYQGMSTSHLTGVSSHSQAVSTQAADSTHAGLAPSADYPVFYFSKKHKSRGQQKNQGDWLDYVKNTLKHTKVEAQVVCERTGFTKEKNRLEQVSQEDLDRRRVKAKAQGAAQQQLEYTKEKPFAARAETIKKYDEERRLKLAHRVAEDKNVDKEKNSKLSETADRTPAQARTANSNYTAHSTKTEPNIKNAVLRKSGSLAPSKLYSTDSHSRPAHKLEKERSGSSAVHKPVSTQRHGQLDARNQKTKQRKPEQPPSTPPASDLLPIEPSFDIRYETCAIWPEFLEDRVIIPAEFAVTSFEASRINLKREKTESTLVSKPPLKDRQVQKTANSVEKPVSKKPIVGETNKSGKQVNPHDQPDNAQKNTPLQTNPKNPANAKVTNSEKPQKMQEKKPTGSEKPAKTPAYKIRTSKAPKPDGQPNLADQTDTRKPATGEPKPPAKPKPHREPAQEQKLLPISKTAQDPKPEKKGVATAKQMSAKRQRSLHGEEQETPSLDGTLLAGHVESRGSGHGPESQPQAKQPLDRSKPQGAAAQKALMLQTADLRSMIPEPMDYSEVIPSWTHVFSQFYQTKNELDILGVMTEIHSSFARHSDIMKKVDSKQLDIALSLSPLELGSRLSQGLHDLIYQKDIFRMMAVVGTTCLRWEDFRQRQEKYLRSLRQQEPADLSEEDPPHDARPAKCCQYFRVVKSKTEVVYRLAEVYDIITKSFFRRDGWRELPHGLNLGATWNLLWSWGKITIDYSKLMVFQRLNHFTNIKRTPR